MSDEELRAAVAHVLMRAGFGSEAVAFDVADDIILTVWHPGLRWDIDDEHMTPEHYAALTATPSPPTPTADEDIGIEGVDWGHTQAEFDAVDESIRRQPETGIDERLLEVLKPFAEFADPRGIVPASHVITQGSPLAKRQLTMGDCYEARAALEKR